MGHIVSHLKTFNKIKNIYYSIYHPHSKISCNQKHTYTFFHTNLDHLYVLDFLTIFSNKKVWKFYCHEVIAKKEIECWLRSDCASA